MKEFSWSLEVTGVKGSEEVAHSHSKAAGASEDTKLSGVGFAIC